MAILEEIHRLEEDVSTINSSVAGELIIGASTIPGTYILPQIAAAFKRDHPDISFEITIDDSSRIVTEVASHKLLVGVVGAKINKGEVDYRAVDSDELILAVPKKFNIPSTISLAQLRALPFIMREKGSGTRKNIATFLNEKGHRLDQLNICATLGSSAAVKEAIKSGLGVSVISDYAIKDEITSGTVKQIRVSGLTMKRSFYLVTSPRRTLPNRYLKFIETITRTIPPNANKLQVSALFPL